MTVMRTLVALLLLLVAGCSDEKSVLKIGGKDFGESQILSEMIAALAEAREIPVVRRIGVGDTRLNLEGLKRGDIDLYVEYNGTGLVMLGQSAMSDGDEATARVRALYEPLGLAWAGRLGFANNYGLVMRADRASALGIETISDLAAQSDTLVIGLDENFEERPLDGFRAMTRRYGMEFADQIVYSPQERPQLYDLLIDGAADVIEGFTTDGQIADYDLVVLEDDLDFFPVYQAAPLYRIDAAGRFPELTGIFAALAGKLTEEQMRELNRRVDIEGQAPRTVARSALAELGLIENAVALDEAEPLRLAASPTVGAEEEAQALRAVRQTFPGRRVSLVAADDPLVAVAGGAARIGIAGSIAFFAPDPVQAAIPRPGFEAVAALGETAVLIIVPADGPRNLAEITTLATGPEGSDSHRAATMIVEGLQLDVALKPLADDDPSAFAAQAFSGDGSGALVMAPLGSAIIPTLLSGGRRVLSLEAWDRGNNLIRYPFLRRVRIPAGTLSTQSRPIETLSSQLVLAGPAATTEDEIGNQGPGASFAPTALPLSAETVAKLNESLDDGLQIDPILPQPASLAPQLPEPPAAVNPAPDISVLNVFLVALLVWLTWLLVRPASR